MFRKIKNWSDSLSISGLSSLTSAFDMGHVKYSIVRGTKWGLAPVKGLGARLMCPLPDRSPKEVKGEVMVDE
jgi:hypothetical protein